MVAIPLPGSLTIKTIQVPSLETKTELRVVSDAETSPPFGVLKQHLRLSPAHSGE